MSSHSKATGPRLVIIEGAEKGKVISLQNGTAVLGRSKGDVLIHDSRISRSHVAIHFDEKTGKVTYTDLKSLNGTLVNGVAKEAGELHDGDKIQLGNTTLDCQIAVPDASDLTEPGRPLPRKLKSSDLGPREPSPHNSPDSESGNQEEEEVEIAQPGWQEKQPSAGEVTKIFFLKKLYLSLPRRTRIYVLCFTAMGFLLLYETMGGGAAKIAALSGTDREIASARKLQSEGRVDEAIDTVGKVKKIDPKNPEVYLLLGDLYLERGKVDNAITEYKEVIKIDPNRGVVYPKLARIYLLQGRREDAENANREIDRLLVEGPQGKDFFVEVANLYLDFRELQVPPQKMVIIGEALQNKFAPGEVVGMKLEALGLILQNFSEQALAILDHAHKLFPQDQSIYQYMVVARLKLKDIVGATSLVDEWEKAFPEDLRPLLVMAQIRYENRQIAEAQAILQHLVQLSPKTPNDPAIPEALNLLGRIYQQMAQPQEALTVLKQSCDMGYQSSCDMMKGNAESAGRPDPQVDAQPSSLPPTQPPPGSP